MGKENIPPRKLVRENWMSFSSAIERLELYSRFLPIHYNRARFFQDQIEQGLPIAPFEFNPHNAPTPGIPPLGGKDWVLYIQSPLMEWEVYWESLYKSIYIMNFIAGYESITNARSIYENNQNYLLSLEDARHTFAHFVKMLPSIKDYTSQKVMHGHGYSKDGFSFKNRKWTHPSDEHNKFMSVCNAFIAAAEIDFQSWSKATMNPPTG